MIYIKKKTDDIDIAVKLDENTEFYAECHDCGKLLEATEDVLDDFTSFLYGSTWLCCEECSAKRENINLGGQQ